MPTTVTVPVPVPVPVPITTTAPTTRSGRTRTPKTPNTEPETKVSEVPKTNPKAPKTSKPTTSTKESVKCLECETEHDLFYDLQNVTETLSDGEEEEGIDIDDERDPIRCILCRKFPRIQCNETIECEECLDTNTVFVWTGRYNDTIICRKCNETEQEKKAKKKNTNKK